LDLKGKTRVSTEATDLQQGELSESEDLQALFEKALKGNVVYSDVFVNDHDKDLTLAFMAPIYNGTTVSGVLVNEVSWDGVAEILNSIEGASAILLNHDGRLVSDNSGKPTASDFGHAYGSTAAFSKIRQETKGSGILPGLTKAGEPTLTSYLIEPGFRDYAGNGWFLVLATPASTALASVRQLTWSLIGLFTAVLVTTALVSVYLLNRRILRPIKELSGAVSRVTLGDLSQTVKVESQDELGILGRNFNEMTYQLAETHRSLQKTTRDAQEGKAQLLSSINGLRQGFIITDAHGSTGVANAAALQMFSEATQPITFKNKIQTEALQIEELQRLFPEAFALASEIKRTIQRKEQAKFPGLPLGGRFVNVYLSPVINEDEAIGCVVLLEDVTEERIMQRSRDEFFSIASHELRTPLTAIRGNTTLIQQFFPKAIEDPNIKEMIADIHESSVRLIEIVNDFLDASRLEQNKMKFEPETFALESVVEKVIYELDGVSRDKGLALKVDQETLGKLPLVYADQNRVKQVLYNLIGNAMKFTKAGNVIVNCLIQGPLVKVCVSDTGPGISPEGQQLLFHKFQQTGDNILTRDDTRGTGLGLYISKLLIEHMGGEIKLEHSELGKGSTFSFTVPVSSASAKPVVVAPVAAAPDPAAEKIAADAASAPTKATKAVVVKAPVAKAVKASGAKAPAAEAAPVKASAASASKPVPVKTRKSA
jgi:signal transduction histidine kinase